MKAKKKVAKLTSFVERQKLKRKHLEKVLNAVERKERRRRGQDDADTPITLDPDATALRAAMIAAVNGSAIGAV